MYQPPRHPRRAEAEGLIRAGQLRAWQIAEKCGVGLVSVRRWAREMGIDRIRGRGTIRSGRSAWQAQGRALLKAGVTQAEVARRCGVSVQSVSNLRWKMVAEGDLPTEGA